MIDIVQFADMYEAKYGKFPVDIKRPAMVEEWKRVLYQIPERKLHEVFSMVTRNRGNSNRNPRTADFENALKQMEIIDTGPSGFKGDGCGVCYGSGVITVMVTYMPDNTKRLGIHEGGYPYSVGSCCKCSKGMWLRRNYYQKQTDSDQESCFQWLIEQTDIAKEKGVRVERMLFMQLKKALRKSKLKHRGKKMDWLKNMLGDKEAADVVRSSGERTERSRPAERSDSGAMPVRGEDDPMAFALPE